ncbi:MAG: peptidoglycan editing factor PgeF [Alicyclobacillaceae bacterium]|nr:peptidoglycan editing factor PgeF [Alicyclobacillaceae bacterium]
MEWELTDTGGVVYWKVNDWEATGRVRARFFSRLGGISRPPFESLNFGWTVGDRREDVRTNRERAAASFGLGPDRWVFTRQVHGNRVVEVTADHAGRGMWGPEDAVDDADGLVTREPGLVLAVLAADCVPVLLFAPDIGAVGAVHAGWRGTALRVAAEAVRKLAAWGADPGWMQAAIGPSIGPCCYEVDDRVHDTFREMWGEISSGLFVPTRPGHYVLDLWQANREVLRRSGVREERMTFLNVCTSCQSGLCYSHRRDAGVTGRMAAAVALLPGREADDRKSEGNGHGDR